MEGAAASFVQLSGRYNDELLIHLQGALQSCQAHDAGCDALRSHILCVTKKAKQLAATLFDHATLLPSGINRAYLQVDNLFGWTTRVMKQHHLLPCSKAELMAVLSRRREDGLLVLSTSEQGQLVHFI